MNALERLKHLVRLADQFRNTPIVDDAFPSYRDRFDNTIAATKRWLAEPRRKIVCLCGSTRFKAAWYAETKRLTQEEMAIVLGVGDLDPRPEKREVNVPIDPDLKARLDALHLDKIDLADEVFVLNVGGYIGESTRREIGFAEQSGKVIRYLEPPSA